MWFPRSFLVLPCAAVLGLVGAGGCGGGDEAHDIATEGPTPTPFSLGTSLNFRGQEVALPAGVAYINQKPQCQQESTAWTGECLNDLKMLVRGDSYILFDTDPVRVIARRIEPEDETDFRPLLGLISGNPGGVSNGEGSPAP